MGSSLVLPLTALVTKEIQENLAKEYFLVKQDLKVDNLLGYYGEMNEETRQEYLREAALELWREGREEALNGLKNLLADIVAILTLVGLVLIGRKQVALIGSVSNRSFLNLPDPIKVFIFILITDMFVGFHSAEGWEVILGGAAHHFGLPENPVFINSFIATVPVVIESTDSNLAQAKFSRLLCGASNHGNGFESGSNIYFLDIANPVWCTVWVNDWHCQPDSLWWSS